MLLNAPRLFLWQHRALYFGATTYLALHSHAAPALHVGIYQPFRLKLLNTDWIHCHCAVIPQGLPHELDFGGNIHGKLFIESESCDFLYFRQRFSYNQNQVTVFHDETLVQQFQAIYEENLSKHSIYESLNQVLGVNGNLIFDLEPRIQQTINAICQEPDYNFSHEQLAAMVNLSPSRFLHLFKQQAGVPYRQFRSWKRLFLAIESLHQCDNMTQAALSAGFFDSAHFSNSFRETFGVKPSFVFKSIQRFELDVR